MKTSIRATIDSDVFDYPRLSDALSDYRNVKCKIGRMLTSGEIIRIKKGIYAFPDYLRREPLNLCQLANMLYGPSYVSCDYALAYYGMIPERVERVTSMTTGRPRRFETPVGNFIYYQHRSADYSVGIDYLAAGQSGYFIASKEKAIYDKALVDKRFDGDDVEDYLLEDLRMDEESLQSLNRGILEKLSEKARGRLARLTRFLLGLAK